MLLKPPSTYFSAQEALELGDGDANVSQSEGLG